MLIKKLSDLVLFLAFLGLSPAHAAVWPGPKPKLIVVLVIDQFRADYLSRYQDKFSSQGFKALMEKGAYFPYGEYDILQSMTGPGHATILTGAYPYQMGIPVNDWYDQKTHAEMYCVEDDASPLVGIANSKKEEGISPKNLIGTTVGDELKNADFSGRMIALAIKDRSAVLMGGHRADMVFWFDGKNKEWISSQFYLPDAKRPQWMVDLSQSSQKEKCRLSEPCGIELTLQAFKSAFNHYKLGQGPGTDIIAVSFSSHDYAGHTHGPNAPEMLAMTLAEDKAIAEIRALIQKQGKGGLENTTFVLTGDHGVAAMPAYLQQNKIEAGYIDESLLANEMNEALDKKYGSQKSKWITHVVDFNFFVDEAHVAKAKASLSEVEDIIKKILLKNSGFVHVFTKTEYEKRQLPPQMFERQITKTYFPGRSGHVIGVLKPFYVHLSRNKANHMTGYTYDRTVPILFSGFGIRNGVFAEKTEVIDIAPTLSFMLGIVPPALSEGKVLTQALKITNAPAKN